MSLDINYNPQSIIDEWNAKNEQDQYNLLKYSIIRAAKNFSMAYALELNEPEELVGEAWIILQNKLNANHIQELAERQANKTINLPFLTLTAASYVLSKVLYNHRRKHKEYGNSINELVGKEENTELMEILPDKHINIENQVISQMMVDDVLKDLKPIHKTVMTYAMEGCTYKEISSMTGIDPQAVAQQLCYIRKKLGRKESQKGKARLNFESFSKAYEMVLAKEVKPGFIRREFNISGSTFRYYATKYKVEHNMPVSKYYQELHAQCQS